MAVGPIIKNYLIVLKISVLAKHIATDKKIGMKHKCLCKWFSVFGQTQSVLDFCVRKQN